MATIVRTTCATTIGIYVSQNEATYYRGHHHGVMRNAYVPEAEYPVGRDPYHGGGHGDGGNHGQNHH
jgi:hypothetical protein